MQAWQMPTGFVAYPSDPPSLSETIREAVEAINATKQVYLKTWQSSQVGGKWIIGEILRQIESSKLFVADVTGLNPNVLFELGYAIAKEKPIWLLLNKTFGDAQWKNFKLLTTIGHCFYTNENEVFAQYALDAPHLAAPSLHGHMIGPHLDGGNLHELLYLKSVHDTTAATKITTRISKSSLKVTVDDPHESPYQSLAWYGKHVCQARAVVCHFGGLNHEGVTLRNARCAFVAGLAVGLDREVLMLVEDSNFLSPLDYRDYLFHYSTARAALRHLTSWLELREERSEPFRSEHRRKEYERSKELVAELRGLELGEHVAENEEDGLVHGYFVETKAYQDALDGKQRVFVGRKGAGKSANFLQLSRALTNDRRNLVAIIKPVAYDMEGLLQVLSSLKERAVQGFAIETLWKFLLYSELALVSETRVRGIDSAAVQPAQRAFADWMDLHRDVFSGDFSERLERCVSYLLSAGSASESLSTAKESISERLHKELLAELRDRLVPTLPKRGRVAFLVDNLDKAWSDAHDMRLGAEFLLGLLTASNRITRELERAASAAEVQFDVTMALFMRADIFERVHNVAREPDKIVREWLLWNDSTMLARIVEERYVAVSKGVPSELWERYFCKDVYGTRTRDYLLAQVIPRPRDFILLVNNAIAAAANRGHGKVEVEDVLEAQRQYSEFAFEVFRVENVFPDLDVEAILMEFVGAPAILTHAEVVERLTKAAVPESHLENVVDFLCRFTFLGLDVGGGDFRFPDRRRDLVKLKTLAASRANQGDRRYTIHRAFHPYLEIDSADVASQQLELLE